MRRVALYARAAAFVAAGAMLFVNTVIYLPMMSPYLLLQLELVYLSSGSILVAVRPCSFRAGDLRPATASLPS